MIGADGSTYTPAGEWQFNFSARSLRSTDHYNTTIEQVQRQTLGTYVENLQKAFDFTFNYQLTQRTSLNVGVPFIDASWSIPTPISPTPGPRAVEPATGIGDISFGARTWVLNPARYQTGNFSVGLGLKMPTGKSDVQAQFPDIRGNNNTMRYVDQSVQPGDGGWGITTELAGFKQVKRVMVFGSLNYLINPKDTNNTPSIIVNLGAGDPTSPNNVNRLVNSVPDQYLVRLGGATSIGAGFSASVAWRMEGMPRYDLIGRSDGFRRPGKEMFIEPGISYGRGANSFSFTVPIAYYRNREPDAYTGNLGDATFPNAIFLGTYSLRFGGPKGSRGPKIGPGIVGSVRSGALPANTAPGAAEAAPLPMPTVNAGQEVVWLNISGMTCDDCVETVQKALRSVSGVESATVHLKEHAAVVVYQPSRTKMEDLVKVVNAAKGMNKYSAQADTATVTLAITGMTCDQCVESVRSALMGVKGVTAANVNLETKLAVVTYEPATTKVGNLVKAVNTAKGMNPYTATVKRD